ncbi:MAG: DNA polymerase III subunit beta [Candidatus Moranbacteria bacterium]|nr:DNA polymerase III subunit beta [Candidatus Moranbacteria bacterium]
MIITCTYENFREALLFIESATGKNSSLSIINNILIEATENQLHFSATNLEIGVIKKIQAKIEQEGSIVVPINLLLNFLTALRGEENIYLELKENQLILKSGIHTTQINSYSAKDFPIIPQSTERNFLKFNLNNFKKIISKVFPFTSSLETRQELTGVLFKIENENIYTVATDSFRLGENVIPVADLINEESEIKLNEDNFIILPKQICLYINKISDSYKNVNCCIENNHLFIECEDLNITAKLIDGNYPDYKQIIPQGSLTSLTVKKDEFIEALKVTTVFVGKDNKEIFFEINDKKMKITTKQQETGSSTTELSISMEGENQEIALNPNYVLEGVRKIEESEISIFINNKMTPVIFKGVDGGEVNEKFTYLVMPVKSVS